MEAMYGVRCGTSGAVVVVTSLEAGSDHASFRGVGGHIEVPLDPVRQPIAFEVAEPSLTFERICEHFGVFVALQGRSFLGQEGGGPASGAEACDRVPAGAQIVDAGLDH